MASQTSKELIASAWAARRENRLLDAKRDLLGAIEISRASGNQNELINALGKLGHVEMDLGHIDQAKSLQEEAVEVSRELGDPFRLGHTLRHLGSILQKLGFQELANQHYEEALSLYRDHGPPPPLDLANLLRLIAISKEQAGAKNEAIQLWEETRKLYSDLQILEGVQECTEHLTLLKMKKNS